MIRRDHALFLRLLLLLAGAVFLFRLALLVDYHGLEPRLDQATAPAGVSL